MNLLGPSEKEMTKLVESGFGKMSEVLNGLSHLNLVREVTGKLIESGERDPKKIGRLANEITDAVVDEYIARHLPADKSATPALTTKPKK